jgi:hypothetical protein
MNTNITSIAVGMWAPTLMRASNRYGLLAQSDTRLQNRLQRGG